MVTSPETAVSEMEMAMKVEELNMEPRELMLDELDDASGGIHRSALCWRVYRAVDLWIGRQIRNVG